MKKIISLFFAVLALVPLLLFAWFPESDEL